MGCLLKSGTILLFLGLMFDVLGEGEVWGLLESFVGVDQLYSISFWGCRPYGNHIAMLQASVGWIICLLLLTGGLFGGLILIVCLRVMIEPGVRKLWNDWEYLVYVSVIMCYVARA